MPAPSTATTSLTWCKRSGGLSPCWRLDDEQPDGRHRPRKLKDSEGTTCGALALKSASLSSLLGYGITENEDMPDIAADAMPSAFGDFKAGPLPSWTRTSAPAF